MKKASKSAKAKNSAANSQKKKVQSKGLRRTDYLLMGQRCLNLFESNFGNGNFLEFHFHLYACQLRNMKGSDGWVPIPWEFRYAEFPEVEIEAIATTGLVDIWEYSRKDHRCYRFKLTETFLQEVLEANLKDIGGEEPLIEVFSRRKVQPLKSKFSDESGNKLPDIVVEHIKSYQCGLFNKERALQFLEDEQAKVDQLRKKLSKQELQSLKQGFNRKLTKKTKEYSKALRRHWNNQACFKGIRACRAVPVGGGLWAYVAPYKVQSAGRITHLFGGPQNATREFQAALFADIPNYFNMDMVSSQPVLLIQLLKEAGLDYSWLETYRTTKNAKNVYSEKAGLPIQVWKDCLNATLMGTQVFEPKMSLVKRFRTLHNVPEEKKSALLKYIYEAADGNPLRATLIYKKFYVVIEPLAKVLKGWHNWLIDELIPKNKKVGKQGNFYILNACGMRKYVTEIRGGKVEPRSRTKLKTEISAWLLQGLEARFIAELAKLSLSPKYKGQFKLIQNYHDGFISEGWVPEAAVQEAAQLAGIQNVRLEEKPFLNPYKEQEEQEIEEAREFHLREYAPGQTEEQIRELEEQQQKLTEEEAQRIKEFEEIALKYNIPLPEYDFYQSRRKAG